MKRPATASLAVLLLLAGGAGGAGELKSGPQVGDVGWNSYEELDVAKPGTNMGWPCYEGPFVQSGYQAYATCQSLYPTGRTAPLLYYTHIGGSTAVIASLGPAA